MANRRSIYHSHFQLPILMIFFIIAAAAEMMIVHALPPMPAHFKVGVGSVIVVFLFSPVFYYFLFRPGIYIGEWNWVEEALYVDRSRLMSIRDGVNERVYTVNRQHEIEYVNPLIEREFGPVAGRKCYEYFHDRTGVCPWCMNQDLFAGKSVQWEWYSFKTGKTCELFDALIRNEDGSDSKLGVFYGITTRTLSEEGLQEPERQLHLLSSQLLTAQETERKRIALDLHDELGQTLTLVKFKVRLIGRSLREDQQEIRGECENVTNQIDALIENVRRLSRDLSPSVLEDLGLKVALRRLVDNFVGNYRVNAAFHMDDIGAFLTQDAKIMIYRIVQEALTNIGRHAGAKNVSLVVKEETNAISFVVEDDGEGFDVAGAIMKDGTERGLGLTIMEERARMIGGCFDLWSEEGRGTRISFVIPVTHEVKD